MEDNRNRDEKVHPEVERFRSDFFNSKEPLTEVMLRLDGGDYIRMTNLDFVNKCYVMVN